MQKNLTKNAHLIDKDDREQEVVDFCNLFPLQLCVSNCQNITMSSDHTPPTCRNRSKVGCKRNLSFFASKMAAIMPEGKSVEQNKTQKAKNPNHAPSSHPVWWQGANKKRSKKSLPCNCKSTGFIMHLKMFIMHQT